MAITQERQLIREGLEDREDFKEIDEELEKIDSLRAQLAGAVEALEAVWDRYPEASKAISEDSRMAALHDAVVMALEIAEGYGEYGQDTIEAIENLVSRCQDDFSSLKNAWVGTGGDWAYQAGSDKPVRDLTETEIAVIELTIALHNLRNDVDYYENALFDQRDI